MSLLHEIQQEKNTTKAMIDMLGGVLSVLDKAEAVLQDGKQLSSRGQARRTNKAVIMQDIIKLDIKQGKPTIAKKKGK